MQIKVLHEGETVGYSYILVNNTIVAVTDSSGVAKLPIDKLNINDTISVQYLGYAATPFICNSDIFDKRELVLNITPICNIDEITITPNPIELLKKSLKQNVSLYNSLKANKFNFSITKINPPTEITKTSGDITMQKWIFSEYMIYDFKSNGDTTGIKSNLAHFDRSIDVLTMLIYNQKQWRDYRLIYNGVNQDSRIFSLIMYENGNSISRLQYLIDKNSKEIKHMELESSIQNKTNIYKTSIKVNYYTIDNHLYINDAEMEIKNGANFYQIKIWDIKVIDKKALKKLDKEIITVSSQLL